MPQILMFTSGPEDWQGFLADPVKHWRTGYSARTLAHCWEAADGWPPEVARALGRSDEPLLGDLTPILAVPEFKVPLPGGARASQNDVFVLAASQSRPVVIMVEGKVDESFGPTLGEWNKDASKGKEQRLSYLLKVLGMKSMPADTIRYQLLHRAVSALITAEQYHAVAAIVLIHSFSGTLAGWPDYEVFASQFGVSAELDATQRLSRGVGIPLFGAWVTGDPSFLET